MLIFLILQQKRPGEKVATDHPMTTRPLMEGKSRIATQKMIIYS